MARYHHRRSFTDILQSRFTTIVLLIIAGAVSIAVGREMLRRITVQQEFHRLSQEIATAEHETERLESLIATLKSATFQEGAIRTKRNLQRPGESVLVIPGIEDRQRQNFDLTTRRVEEGAPRTNTQRWWQFLFRSSST